MTKLRTGFIVAGVVLASAALWLAAAFYGLPWKEKALAGKLEAHLEKKYEKDFVLKESYFNFKDGKYGGSFYPKDDPSLAFYADEGYGEYKYADDYPGVVWSRQLKEELEPEAKKAFPHMKTIQIDFVRSENVDMVKGPAIPHYSQADAELFVRVELEGDFSGSKEQWQAIAQFIRSAQSRSAVMEVSFNFVEKKSPTEALVMCPMKNTAVITNGEQAQKKCSIARFDAETTMLID